ncbi:MAG: hypothetical protein RLZZ577_81 [Bacteroidota bacterium]|jgi:hypothetical protein
MKNTQEFLNKAKLYKVEMYILDIDNHYGILEHIIEHINDRLENVSLHAYNIHTVEFEWCDEHILNYSTCKYEDYKGMFGLKREYENGY